MAKRALVDSKANKVVNVIELEDDANWEPPKGHYLLDKLTSLDAATGDIWDGVELTRPIITPPVLPRDLIAEIDEMKADLDKIKVELGFDV